ncbi:hypothetical protein BD410DRAFT_782456 [Rickenella mellea]|uniref:FAR-17a/AIG1-like protein n=1 Tax=Rickenella mellea TaxID=50990 RepID=A0A4Y7QIA8_9AGAM|nr:hypothetical protein BD410DRAFT_782456 [Rickenella mellea]
MAWGYLGLNSLPLDAWIKKQKGGHFQYLTIQGLAIAWLTMMASLACDLFPSNSGIRRFKRALFMIALPLAVVISTIYWTLITLLPSLILQADQTQSEPTSAAPELSLMRIPLRVDLALHATPALTLLANFFLFETRYSIAETKYPAAIVTTLYGIFYALWVEYCAKHNGHFPYPFLEHPLRGRLLVYSGASLLALLSFRAINSMHPRYPYPLTQEKFVEKEGGHTPQNGWR